MQVTDASLVGGQSYNWTKDKVYLLNGPVFLEEGGVLNIEAGTVIKGAASEDTLAAALVITRGAFIIAQGTAEEPIIFTAEDDDINDPEDLNETNTGLWGGLVILGKGIVNIEGDSEPTIEGTSLPDGDTRGDYGGTDNADSSGVLRYVSIRHSGNELAPGDELNGLSLGAVGSRTVLEYIDVYAGSDDGIEFFGGAAELKYATVSFCEDDSFDWDYGWKGKGQFWFVIQGGNAADNGGEFDGADDDDNDVFSDPTIYNMTFIGSGFPQSDLASPLAFLMRDNTAGVFNNGVFTDFALGLEIEDLAGEGDAAARVLAGELVVENHTFARMRNNATDNLAGIVRFTTNDAGVEIGNQKAAILSYLSNPAIGHEYLTGNAISNIDRVSGLDPRATAAVSPQVSPLPQNDAFFSPANYRGAFEPTNNEVWIQRWTALADNEYVSSLRDEAVAFDAVTLYPNPTEGSVEIAFSVKQAGGVDISIVDLQGRLVQQVMNDARRAGDNMVQADVSGLSAGVYVVKIVSNNSLATRKLVIK
ncbi:MAG: T9SS type A sorting domain-containing protein [Catalinimonas sp.]